MKSFKQYLNKKTLTPEHIAKKHGITLKQVYDQLEKGVRVEMEHTKSQEIASEIALDHLKEIPDYYDKLHTMEKSAKK